MKENKCHHKLFNQATVHMYEWFVKACVCKYLCTYLINCLHSLSTYFTVTVQWESWWGEKVASLANRP